jgi:hypothetical protein
MTNLKVVPIYEQNFRDIRFMLEKLSGDVVRDEVKAVASVCFRHGELDVRGLGDMARSHRRSRG